MTTPFEPEDYYALGRGLGEDLTRDFGELLKRFLDERVVPLSQMLGAPPYNQDPTEVFRSVAAGLRSTADILDGFSNPQRKGSDA